MRLLDKIINLLTILIFLPALIALTVQLYAFSLIYNRGPLPATWEAVAACEDLAGRRLVRVEVQQIRRWYYVQSGACYCRLYWGYEGRWAGSALIEAARVEVEEVE